MNNSQIKYPYIGKGSRSGVVFLFFREGEALVLDGGECALSGHKKNITETICRNITHEFLQNTYGEVVSPEHAEFIVELCNANNIPLTDILSINSSNHFVISRTGLAFYNCTRVSSTHLKQITIPLPPKAPETLSADEETELKSRAMASELNSQSNDDEWPKIGDEFIHKGQIVTCISKGVMSDGGEVITFEFADRMSHGSCWNNDTWIKKPKTPEDLLIEELQTKLVKNNAVDNWMLAANIISGDIEGLTYKSDIESAVKSVINKNLDGDL